MVISVRTNRHRRSFVLAASVLVVESHDRAQLSAGEEDQSGTSVRSISQAVSSCHHQPIFLQRLYNVSELQSNFYISSHKEGTPEGTDDTGPPNPPLNIYHHQEAGAPPPILLILLALVQTLMKILALLQMKHLF